MKKKIPVLAVLMAAAVTTGCGQKEANVLQGESGQADILQEKAVRFRKTAKMLL